MRRLLWGMTADTPARRAALRLLLEDWEASPRLATSSAALTEQDDMMIERLIERGELTWIRADLWSPTPAGVAAARAAREEAP